MLQLYDINHNKIDGLTNYKELKIEKEINIEDTFSFLYPISDLKHDLIQEECYIRTKDNEYIVKEVNFKDDDWTEYICKINIEGIKGKDVSHFETVEQSCTNSINLALVGTGWTIGTCDVTKLRTVRKNNCTAYVVLQEIQSAYDCEMTFDSINKKVYIYQSMGTDKGTYFAEQLNLKKLDIQRNSYDYITRLIPLGKDGLGIASINGGLNYIENYQYSNKVITAYWEDNRYTVAQDLKDDAIVRLDYLSKPYAAYKAEVIDLANINTQYAILDYSLGDTITLLAKSKNTKEQQRIIKLTEYPDEPERNTCEIANKILSLENLQVRFIDTADVVETVTTVDGLVDGTKVDGIDWSQLQNVHIVIADIQDLSVVTGRIGTLETTTAHITNGIIDNATIDMGKVNNLSSTYATIVNLTAANGNITSLTSSVASINTLLAGNVGAANLAAGAIQAGSAVIGTAAIASGQIISLDVLKLIAGNISTNKFTVQSDNGKLKIVGDTIKLWDVAGKERVSLGLNSGDYNLLIRGVDGTTVLFGTDGVTHAGITQGAVDDSNIATNANINGGKIEKESLVSQVNGATTLVKSSHVKYDPTGQTLEVAFGALSTTVTGQGTTVTSQGTSISTLQGQIVLKASQTDLTTTNSNVTAAQTQATLGVTNAAIAQTKANQGVADALTAHNLADTGVTNAATAQAAAVAAQGTATNAKAYTDNLASGTAVTPDEKLSLKQEWDLIVVDGALTTGKIIVQALAFGVSDTAFDTAYSALNIYLNTTLTLFTSMTTTTVIVRATWDTTWKNYYNAKTDILNAIATTAKARADLGVTNAATAQAQATLGVTNAATAQTAANLANTNATALTTRVTTAEASITTQAGQIVLKALATDLVTTNSNVTGVTSRMATAEASLIVNANNIALKVNSNGVIASINASAEGISINAAKLNLTGLVTVANLSASGTTVINGANITTGKILATYIDVTNLSVYKIISSGNVNSYATMDTNPSIGISSALTLHDATNANFISIGLGSSGSLPMTMLDVSSQMGIRINGGSVLFTIGTGSVSIVAPDGSSYIAIQNGGMINTVAPYGLYVNESPVNKTGTSIEWNTNTCPDGYLFENGQAVSRTTYSRLFGTIGTVFGAGDGSATFNLPDSRGRMAVGTYDGGGALASNISLGQKSGSELVTLTVSQIPSHYHSMPYTHSVTSGSSGYMLGNTKEGVDNSLITGGGAAFNNMSPYIVKRKIIKF